MTDAETKSFRELLEAGRPPSADPEMDDDTALVKALIDEGVQRCIRASVRETEELGPDRMATPPPRPQVEDLFEDAEGLPSIARSELNAKTLASGLLHHGALIVRELYDADQRKTLRECAELEEESGFEKGMMGRCSNHTLVELLKAYEACGLLAAVRDYLGDDLVMLKGRSEVRKKYSVPGKSFGLPWHQDVNFFGAQSYAVNCWASVTGCGEDSPGLTMVPRRFDERVGWDEARGRAPLTYGLKTPKEVLEEAMEGHPQLNVILGPGDAIIFDEMALHRTGSTPWATDYNITTISWFFRSARFLEGRIPVGL